MQLLLFRHPGQTILIVTHVGPIRMIVSAALFDVYEGKGIEEGKKSLAIEVTLQPRDKTLTDEEIDVVAGLDARGFIIGAALAYQLNVGFVPIRKKGKLPFDTVSQNYALEYGEATVEYRASGLQARLRAGPQAIAPRPDNLPDAPVARVIETVTATKGPSSLRGAKVLIVEDAVLLALELELGLSDAGADVIGPAYELEEALALLDRPIDAAVLDANLNGRSVQPVAEALYSRRVPFVFATGYGEAGGAPGGFEAPVIRKPYDVTQVAAAVAELLASR